MQKQIDKEKEYNENKDSYYNMNIQIFSMNQLTKSGWKVESRNINQENKAKQVAIISVLGNKNSGKSFILHLLTDKPIPNGYSVTTKGLSLIIPDNDKNKDDNLILIDTAGTDSPLLSDILKEENQEENENPIIENILKDRQITDYFIQKFILEKSDIFICIIDNLTLTEQKFINRIIKYYKHKKIFIVHNLKTFIKRKQVEDYIKDTLLQSLTFDLEKEEYNDLTEIKIGEEQNVYYYKQKFKENDRIIIHLIMANQDSEAGKYYNNFTISYLNTQLKQVKEKKPFDVIKNLKDFLVSISGEILKTKLEPNSLSEDENVIKVNIDKLELKDFSIDILGNNIIKDTVFTPKYRYGFFVDKDKKEKKLFIEIELFAKWVINQKIELKDSNFIITINGEKSMDIPKRKYISYNYTQSNKFNLEIKIGIDKGFLKEEPEHKEENGLHILIYSIKSKSKEEKIVDDGSDQEMDF